jgi:COP9 signalosome complex subunit 5
MAIVIDPHRTMSAGKVEIGCFRTYSEAYIKKIENERGVGNVGNNMNVRNDKVEELGMHYHKYFSLETSFYKTSLDNQLLDQLWNQYWHSTLASSPLLNSQKEITNQTVDISLKIKKVS